MVGGAEEMVDTLDYITVPATAAAAAAAALQTQPFKWKFRKIWSWAGLGWAGLAGLGWLGWCRQQTTKVQPSQGAGPWNISRHGAHWILDHTEVAVPGLYHSPP